MACRPRTFPAFCWMHASSMGGPATCANWRILSNAFWRMAIRSDEPADPALWRAGPALFQRFAGCMPAVWVARQPARIGEFCQTLSGAWRSDLMNRLTRRYGVPAPHFSSVLLDACQQYGWPGNLRELENFAKRFLAHGDEAAALQELYSHPEHGANKGGSGSGNDQGKSSAYPLHGHTVNGHTSEEKSSLKLLVRNAKGEAERGAISQALEQTQWNRKAAARLLNVSYLALLYKIQEYRLSPPAGLARFLDTDDLRQGGEGGGGGGIRVPLGQG